MGNLLTLVDRAVLDLGDEVVRLEGSDGQTYLELAEPPRGGSADPGLRLLPEFDGLLLGYEGTGRDRFAQPEHLERLWARVNGLFSPAVLHDGRILTKGKRHDVEVEMLPGHSCLADDEFNGQIESVEHALDLQITDLRVRTAR